MLRSRPNHFVMRQFALSISNKLTILSIFNVEGENTQKEKII